MNLHITGRHVAVTEALKEYVARRFAHVEKYRAKLEDAHVILAVDAKRQVCEAVVTGKNIRIAAKESSPDLYASIDQTVDKVARQLQRFKEKTREGRHKHRPRKDRPPVEGDRPTP